GIGEAALLVGVARIERAARDAGATEHVRDRGLAVAVGGDRPGDRLQQRSVVAARVVAPGGRGRVHRARSYRTGTRTFAAPNFRTLGLAKIGTRVFPTGP